jgi:hypothetical protein
MTGGAAVAASSGGSWPTSVAHSRFKPNFGSPAIENVGVVWS